AYTGASLSVKLRSLFIGGIAVPACTLDDAHRKLARQMPGRNATADAQRDSGIRLWKEKI
ncbi:MAG: hypothetical protein WBP90_11810, partial [Terracidiphilus sp.]